MSDKSIKVGLEIVDETKQFRGLAMGVAELEKAGAEVEELKDSILELAKQQTNLTSQKNLINQFKRLKKESIETADAIDKQQKEIAKLAKQMKVNPTKELTKSFNRAKRSAKQLKENQKGLQISLQKTRNELKKSSISTKNLGSAQKQLANRSAALSNSSGLLAKKMRDTRKEMEKTAKATKQMDGSVGKSGSGLKGMALRAGAAGTAIAALTSVTQEMLNIDKEFDRMEKSFTEVTGSTEAANVEMGRMIGVANKLGLSFTEISRGYVNFAAAAKGANYTFSQSSELFEQTSKKILALGGSTDDVNGVLLAFSQTLSKGTVSTEELNQVAERLPGTFQFAADALGTSTGELRDLIATGKIAANDFLPKFVAQLQSTGKVQETNAQTSAKLRNEWNLLVNSLDSSIGVSESVQDSMSGLSKAIKLMRMEADGDIDIIPDNAASNVIKYIPLLNALSLAHAKIGEKISEYVDKQMEAGDANAAVRQSTDELTQSLIALNIARKSSDKKDDIIAEKEYAAALEKTNKAFGHIKIDEEARSKSIADMNDEIKALTPEQDKLKKSLEELGKAGLQNTVAYRNQSAEFERLDNKLAALKQTAEDVSKVKVGIIKPVDAEKQKQAIGDIIEKIGQQKQAIEEAKKSIASLNSMAGTGNTFFSSQENIERTKNLTDSIKENESSVKRLSAELSELDPMYKSFGSNAEEAKNILDSSTTKMREQKQAMEAIEEAAKRAGISMGEMTKGIKDDESDIIKNISTDIDNISKSSKQSGESIERYLNGALGKVQSTEGMKALLAQMQAMPNKTKETATAIEELKTKINSATPDFVNLGNAIKSATDSSQLNELQMALKAAFDEGKLTAEQYEAQLVNVTEQQNEINQANSDAITVEQEKAYAMAATSQAQQQSTEATEQATDAIKEQAQAVKEVEESKQSLYSTEGLTNEQLQKQVQLTQELHQGTARLREARVNVDFRKQLQDNAEAFREVNESIAEMEGKISDGSISISDLGKSFYDARDGAVELDEVTMERINAAVDKARRKLAEMAQAAKDGAESLEIQLARENGDDEGARKIEQAKKLADIKEKLAQAAQRGNSEEIQAYERQLELQKQIYQAKAKKEQEKQQQRQPEPQSQKPTQEPAPQIQNTVRQRQQPQQPPQRLNVNVSEITQAVNQGISQSDIGSLVSEVIEASAQGVINKMREEMKRQR